MYSQIPPTVESCFAPQQTPPVELDVEYKFNVFQTGIKNKFLIISIWDGYCWLLNENKWKLIGHGPCLNSSWECERKMVKLDSLSTTDKLCFFEFVTEQQDACYFVEFDMKTDRIGWTEIGSNKYDPNDPIYDYDKYMWWHFYSVECDLIKFGVNKDKALIIPGFQQMSKTNSLFIMNVHQRPEMHEIENCSPIKFDYPKIIPITINGKEIHNKFIVIGEDHEFKEKRNCNTKPTRMFEMTVLNDTSFEFRDIETTFYKRFGMRGFTHFVFNDYLVIMNGTIQKDYDHCWIFSYKDMRFVGNFRFSTIFATSRTLIDYGIVHLFTDDRDVRHTPYHHYYTLDIANLFNHRNQKYYSILDGLNNNKDVYIDNELSRLLFDFVDDGFIVEYFEKPWEIEYFAMKRHRVWYELKSLVSECESKIAYEHTLGFMKLLFDFIDDVNIQKQHLYKPWMHYKF